MSFNSFGNLFRLTSFGESHGTSIGGVVDGVPSGLFLDESHIQPYLDERKPGSSRAVTPRQENDKLQFLSGVFQGKTTGTPIGFVVENQSMRSFDYEAIKDILRPGHADYTYQKKYGLRDYRGGGRASARESIARVVGGSIARIWLQKSFGVEISATLHQIGSRTFQTSFEQSKKYRSKHLFCTNSEALMDDLDTLRREGDSVGGSVLLRVRGVPLGLGEPIFDRLGALLSYGLMSLPAAKAVAIGDGLLAPQMKGSDYRDAMDEKGFLSNHAGGMLGGISTGEELYVLTHFKPTSSIRKPIQTQKEDGSLSSISVKGRHDPCVAIRAVPLVEAMAAMVLADLAMCHQGRAHGQSFQE